MTQDSTVARIVRRLRREITEMRRAHDVMWENLTRLDPDPSPYLHWEPSATGWRLYGSLPPPGRDATYGRRPGTPSR